MFRTLGLLSKYPMGHLLKNKYAMTWNTWTIALLSNCKVVRWADSITELGDAWWYVMTSWWFIDWRAKSWFSEVGARITRPWRVPRLTGVGSWISCAWSSYELFRVRDFVGEISSYKRNLIHFVDRYLVSRICVELWNFLYDTVYVRFVLLFDILVYCVLSLANTVE